MGKIWAGLRGSRARARVASRRRRRRRGSGDVRRRERAERRRRGVAGRASPQIYPPDPAQPASINNGRERFGLGAHSVLKATFMALETGAGSLAGVVLEARGVWPVERSPYASALANGGLVGENLEKAPRGMCETILTARQDGPRRFDDDRSEIQNAPTTRRGASTDPKGTPKWAGRRSPTSRS